VNEPLPAQSSLSIAGITNQTFYPSSLIYGPQAVKPAGNGGAALWVGQNTSDPTTDAYLMFIDLYAGDLKSSDPYTGLVNNGALAVNFSFTGLYGDTLALNVYAWNGESQGPGEGLGFTNSTASTGSGYEIVDTAVAPVPVPPSLFLLAGGLGGLGMLRKRWVSR
jgi:hypothetical protein